MIVIFDLDGTLLNTLADITAAVNHALVSHGFPSRTEAEILPCLGHGTDYLLTHALPAEKQNLQTARQLRADYQTYYNNHLTDFTVPYAGVTDMLSTLHARGIKLAVASNKYHAAVKGIVKKCFPQVEFDVVLGQKENAPAKPDPFVVREILRLCGEQAENCLYVGDSDVDMQTARNARVKACAVTWGFQPRERLLAAHPDYVAHTPLEILSFI